VNKHFFSAEERAAEEKSRKKRTYAELILMGNNVATAKHVKYVRNNVLYSKIKF